MACQQSLLVFEWAGLVPGNESRTGTLFIKVFDLERLLAIAIILWHWILLGMLLLPISSSVVLKLIKRQEVLINRWWIGLVCLLWAGVFVATGGRTYITQSVGYFLHNAHLGPVLFADPPHPDGSWTYLGDVKWIPLLAKVTPLSILSLPFVLLWDFQEANGVKVGFVLWDWAMANGVLYFVFWFPFLYWRLWRTRGSTLAGFICTGRHLGRDESGSEGFRRLTRQPLGLYSCYSL